MVLIVTTHKLVELQDSYFCTMSCFDHLFPHESSVLLKTTKQNMYSLPCHARCICLLNCSVSRMLKGFWYKKTITSHPHTVAYNSEGGKSSVPFNTKGRQSKTEEDSLTVWGRLVAHNRCYSLINNSVCQGWACAPHPSEAQCDPPQNKWTCCIWFDMIWSVKNGGIYLLMF